MSWSQGDFCSCKQLDVQECRFRSYIHVWRCRQNYHIHFTSCIAVIRDECVTLGYVKTPLKRIKARMSIPDYQLRIDAVCLESAKHGAYNFLRPFVHTDVVFTWLCCSHFATILFRRLCSTTPCERCSDVRRLQLYIFNSSNRSSLCYDCFQ